MHQWHISSRSPHLTFLRTSISRWLYISRVAHKKTHSDSKLCHSYQLNSSSHLSGIAKNSHIWHSCKWLTTSISTTSMQSQIERTWKNQTSDLFVFSLVLYDSLSYPSIALALTSILFIFFCFIFPISFCFIYPNQFHRKSTKIGDDFVSASGHDTQSSSDTIGIGHSSHYHSHRKSEYSSSHKVSTSAASFE